MKMTNGIMKVLFDTMNQQGFMDNATGATGYALYRNIRILSNELKDYNKVIDDAIKKYGKKDKNTGGYIITPDDTESIEKFTKEITPIAELEVDVDLYQVPIELFELPYCETAAPSHYAMIEEFLVKHEDLEVSEANNKTNNDEDIVIEG